MAARSNEKAVKGETATVFKTRRHGFNMIGKLPTDERGVAAQRCGPEQTMMAHVEASTETGDASLTERK